VLPVNVKLIFGLLCFQVCAFAQFDVLNHEVEWMFDKELSKGDTSWNSNISSIENNFIFEKLPSDTFQLKSKYSFVDWAFNKNIYGFKSEDYTFALNPIFDLQLGSNNCFSTRRGGYARGTIGGKFRWITSFYENYQSFDPRITQVVRETAIAPGEAEVKNPFGYFDYSVSSGGLNYKFTKFFDITAGHGKNFLGNGYRSVLLSDASGNYPFVKTNLKIGRVNYSMILAEFIDFTNNLIGDGLKRKKYGSFHYMDVLASKKLKIAFFEAVIWEGDSLARTQLDINYMNPFVILRPLEYNIGSPDNMLIGLNGSWDVHKTINVYGQVVLDELHSSNLINNPTWWANKYGYQSGFKIHNLPGHRLVIIGEHNSVRPFTYSHRTSGMNYGHNYNPLAHPYGANFREVLGIINYRVKRFNFNSRLVYISGGEEVSDSISSGKDIFKSYNNRLNESGYKIGNGTEYKQLFLDSKLSFILNSKYLLMFEIGYQNRTEWIDDNKENHHYLYGGFRTSLFNLYYDY
tara:strand:- start:393 stop:1946 length:1554 start_codon:yes stop_codon:yes gene_type:complete